MENTETLFGHGKICYIEIPSRNLEESASFYAQVFGWKIRRDGNQISFDDRFGYVSGMWTSDRPAARVVGMVVSIMVDNAAETVENIEAHGGKIVQNLDKNSPIIYALFSDPSGNIWSIYQHGG